MNLAYFILILGFLGFSLLALYTFKTLGRGWSLKQLLKDFNRKIWMTLSLGILFFGLYLLIVLLSSYFIHQFGSDFIFMAYHRPIELLYGALWLFACMSLSIYLARMFIKYLYLKKGKDH